MAKRPNRTATGAPTISGTAKVGQTLTADTSGIADADGLSNVSYSYQWIGNDGTTDTDISGATSSSYILLESDEGDTIKVKVLFTDDAGYDETLTSTSTEAVSLPVQQQQGNSPATGTPTISGTAQVGQTLTVNTSGISDPDGLTSVSYNYQWIAHNGYSDTDISGATSSSYTLLVTEGGKYIKVKVSFTDDAGNDEELTSPATTAVMPPSPGNITVVITEDASDPDNVVSNFTATLNDGMECAVGYNAYLNVLPSTILGNETVGSQVHIGSATSTGTEMTKGLTGIEGGIEGFDVELYCGTDDSGRLVSRVHVPSSEGRPSPGTHSSGICDRTEQIRDAILAQLAWMNISDCKNVTDPYMSYVLVLLGLENSGITELQAGDFEGLSWLGSLNLSRNNLSPLPEGVFDDLGSLIVLYLDINHITELPAGVFDNLSQLRYLNLGNNGLRELPAGVFDNLSNLRDLYLGFRWEHNIPDSEVYSENNLADLPAGVFRNLSNLETLSISDNNLSVLPDGMFTGLTNLDQVNLIGNPGATFTIQAELEQYGDAVVVKVTEGAPFDMLVTLSAEGSTLSTTTVTVNGGTDSSEPVTVIPSDEESQITVNVDSADFQNYASHHTRAIRAGTGVSLAFSRNSPATGTPAISGTVHVGQALTADTAGISDADGLTNVSYGYQWIGNDGTTDTDISGATSSNYTLQASDEGDTIKVRVSFKDDRGYAESLTSTSTEAVAARTNSPATGAPTISGTAQVGQTLTADTSGISDADGLTNVSYSYQWISNDGTTDTDITGATSSTHTLVDADEGKYIKVKVSFTDDADNDEELTSSPTGKVVKRSNRAATGAPTISGTAKVGQTLTADTSGIADADRLTNVSYSYQWIGNDGNSDTNISGATSSSYLLLASDEGNTIKVKVSFTDDAGYDETLTSASTEAVSLAVQQQLSNSAATGAPTISGTAQVGQTLTADTSGISDADGLTNVSYSYQWIGNDGATDTDISGATSSSYTLMDADEGKYIKVKVSFTDDADNDEELTSSTTMAVIPPPPGYITVVVTEDTSDPDNIVSNFRITWNDMRECASEYNAYLSILPSFRPGNETDGSQVHIGSASSTDTEMTKGLTGVEAGPQGYDVELYCGPDDSGRMVSMVYILQSERRPLPGRYSSEPRLSALGVSHGTMTPAFNSYTEDYSIPDIPNANTRVTITPNPKTGYFVRYYEGLESGVFFGIVGYGIPLGGPRPGSGQSAECAPAFNDDLGPLLELTDADLEMPGFQVDVYDGGTSVGVGVFEIDRCGIGEMYQLSLTREDGSVSLTRPNTPARGLPYIRPIYTRGPYVGLTMNANVSQVSDRDGWATSTFSYQWLADDTEITGATSSSYTVTDAELGKVLKVRVTFTDDRGTEEALTSRATLVVKLRNQDPTGKPVIVGKLEVGQTLRADVSGISDPNGLSNATFSYFWSGFNGPVKDGEEYTLVERDAVYCSCSLLVTYTDDAGHEQRVRGERVGEIAARSDSRATGAPTISGAAQVGETLTADTTGIADDDGLSNVSYSYQWIGNDGATDTDISGATSSSYTLQASDEGDTIKVRVSFKDDRGYAESLISTSTEAVAARANSPATGAPTISGTAKVGRTLAADTSGISDADGLSNVSYSYQWIANDGTTDTDISGATSSSYMLLASDEGDTIKVRVSFTDDAGYDETLTSRPTETVSFVVQRQRAANSPATGVPTISGTAQVGQTLTADTSGISDADGLSNVSYSYQWISNDGTTDTDITGATSSRYTLLPADEGDTIKVRVTFTDDGGNTESLTSATTQAVSPALRQQRGKSNATGEPTISGTAQVGQTLTADTSSIADGLSGVTFIYQWLADDAEIAGATSSSYTLAPADRGKTIRVRVSLTSAATAAVVAAPNSPATGAPTISGTAQVGQTLTADTSGVTDSDGLTNVSYTYQWIGNDGTDTDISGATSSTYTLRAADEGSTIKVRVSFNDDAGNAETLTSTATEAVAAAPLRVALEDEPVSHNGVNAFSFLIRFSEEFRLGFRKLRDHAFTVTGGTVTRAFRENRPTNSNILWRITVQPSSDGDVTVVLPVTVSCGAQGAICTSGGKKLSNRLEFTVSGPRQ